MKSISLCLFVFALTSCSGNRSHENISWHTGDDIRQLKFLNEIETPIPNEFSVLNEHIEFSSQVHSGILIENTFVKKISSKDGQLHSVHSSYNRKTEKLNHLNYDDYKVSKDLHKKILAHFAHVTEADLKSLEAVIDENNQLMWRLLFFGAEGAPYILRFDKDLKILSVKSVGTNLFDGAALVFPRGPKFSELKEVPIKNLSFRPALSNPLYLITSLFTNSFTETEKTLRYNPEDPRFDQVQVYYYVGRTLDWIRDVLKLEISIPLDIQIHIGAPQKTNAAFYYQGKIRLGAGDDVVYARIPQDHSIVSHEVFHSVVDTLARLPHEGEGGSLNEAFADFFTALLLGRPYLGESAYLQGPFKRSIENNKKWSEKSGALYGDSLIISGLLWELSQNIGEVKIRLVALKTLSHLNPLSQFSDFNTECRSALQEILSTEELGRAQAILIKRGFPL